MNEALENLLTRRSIRKYKPTMIPMEIIEEITRAGTYAATAMGAQSPIIVAVTDKDTRNELSKMNAEIMGTSSDPFYGAPVVLVVLAARDIGTYVYDGSLVMGNMMNAAHALGLGSCWIHRAKETFESARGKELLKKWGIEGDYEGIGNLIVGYTDGDVPDPKPRKEPYVYYVK